MTKQEMEKLPFTIVKKLSYPNHLVRVDSYGTVVRYYSVNGKTFRAKPLPPIIDKQGKRYCVCELGGEIVYIPKYFALKNAITYIITPKKG